MLSPEFRMRVIEVGEVTRTAIHRTHRHTRLTGINAVEVAERFKRGLERRGVVVARRLRRAGDGGQRWRETRHEKALLPFHDRAHRLSRREGLANGFTGI